MSAVASRAVSPTFTSLDGARPVSVWLDRPDHLPDAPALDGRVECELLVVGAGLTGLWAAIDATSSGLSDVVVVDSGVIGGGASGRCGGFINASITHGIAHGHARWPDEMSEIVRIQEAIWDDTMVFLETHGASEVVQPNGKLTVATRPHQVAGLREFATVLEHYNQQVELLDGAAVQRLVHSPTYLGGVRLHTATGTCDPMRLVEVLAEAAVAGGARLAQHTHVDRIRSGRSGPVVIRTTTGSEIRAEKVLLATNAYRPLRRQLRRRVIPVYDHVIATAPLTSSQWESIGWVDRVGIIDSGNQFHYYRPTPDGGILFGGWDATYHYGGKVDERLEQRPVTHRLLVEHLLETFPQLDGVEVSHKWGGPIDSTSRFTPMFGTALGGRLGWAVGFTGLGVGASRFGALAALDLLLGRETDRTELSIVRRGPIPFPPEPLRTPVIAWTKRALAAEDRTGRRGPWLRLLHRMGVGFDS